MQEWGQPLDIYEIEEAVDIQRYLYKNAPSVVAFNSFEDNLRKPSMLAVMLQVPTQKRKEAESKPDCTSTCQSIVAHCALHGPHTGAGTATGAGTGTGTDMGAGNGHGVRHRIQSGNGHGAWA